MEKRNSFLTFIAALIPGVGYMYLGLVKKGLQVLVLFLLIKHFFPLLGMGFMNDIIVVPFWFYTFFDTFHLAGKIKRGEVVSDSEFVFEKHTGFTISNLAKERGFFVILAWALILLGLLAITNRMFEGSHFYQLMIAGIQGYFFPILLIGGGIYMLFKEKEGKKG